MLEFKWAAPMVKLGSEYVSLRIVESFSETGKAIYQQKLMVIPENLLEINSEVNR